MRKYRDVPMDYADATLVELAEDLDTAKVFTLDFTRHPDLPAEDARAFKIYPPTRALSSVPQRTALAERPLNDFTSVHEEGLDPPRLAAPEPKCGWRVSRRCEM